MSKENSKHTFDNSDTNSDHQYTQSMYPVVVKMTIPIKKINMQYFFIFSDYLFCYINWRAAINRISLRHVITHQNG
jgi:hypothetical protein